MRGDTLLLRLGSHAQRLRPSDTPLDVTCQESIDCYYSKPERFDTLSVAPGELILCPMADEIGLPDTVVGLIGTMSHLARLGLMTHLDSPIVDPGTDGAVTLELLNVGPRPLLVPARSPVAKLALFRTGERVGIADVARPNRAYASARWMGSRYATEFGGSR